ncbi:MAG: metallophosphoesterase [Bacteroidales bacterium]|nr:metallophosphoesterase [Bacteroidales bacterium]
MGLRLLHLSDIHFTSFNGKYYLDQDNDIRNELENDLEELIEKTGSINAILIGGDISFSGKDSEYQIANNWIKRICKIINCSEENVLTVPGNHDIDRSKICSVVSAIHLGFKNLNSRTEIDKMLQGYLESDESCSILLRPLNNYLNFAQKFCVVPEHNPLYWEKDFSIDGETLRIRGINSAIISDAKDDEHQSKLVLGSIQTTFNRESGVIYLVLCHHPPEWLLDHDEVDRDLLARTKLHLFGHKHNINVLKINECLRLTSGAMQPSRADKLWDPRYNIIELNISPKSDEGILNAKIWKRVWDQTKMKFKADFTSKGEEIHSIELKYERLKAKHISEMKEGTKPNNQKTSEMSPQVEVINVNKPDPIRKLAYLFLGLPYHKRISIANELKFIEDSDIDLTEVQKSQAYFRDVHK